jgi:hypothetical protein
MDNFWKRKRARCRKLAEASDPFTKRRLLHLAVPYDERLLGKAFPRRMANLPTELPA